MKFCNCVMLVALAMLICTSAAAQPNTLWTRTYGGTAYDMGYSVQQTDDGGYIVVGCTGSMYDPDVYLIKTDVQGNELWSQTYGVGYSAIGYSVQQTDDSGYIIAGETHSDSTYDDVYLIKTDSLGNQQWYRTYGGWNTDCGRSIQQTDDGGYIIAGYTHSYGAGQFDVYLVKTDGSGNQQWHQTFGGTANDKGYSVQQTDDGGYIIAGYTHSDSTGSDDVYLVKTDEFGLEQWHQTYGGSSIESGRSVQQTDDGGYIIAGKTNSFGAGLADVYLIKTDASGAEEWTRTYGGTAYDMGYSVQQTDDGGYIIAGETLSYGTGFEDVYLIKTDASGIEQWHQTYGGFSTDEGYCVQQTTDDGYIIAGITRSYGAGDFDVYLISVALSYLSVTLTPHNPPIVIPAGGGSFQFDIEIANNGGFTYTVDVWTDVTLPSGVTYPIVVRGNLNLSAGSSIVRDSLEQFVPGTALAGMYAYNGYIRDHATWELLAQDSFPFEKFAGDEVPSHSFGWALFGWEEEGALQVSPVEYALHQAYPNPFNPTTILSFSLPEASQVNLVIYDISGRLVMGLVDGWRSAGYHEVTFDGSALASGMYICRIEAVDFTSMKKMVLMK